MAQINKQTVMASGPTNLPLRKAMATTILSHNRNKVQTNGIKSWAKVLSDAPPPENPQTPQTPKLLPSSEISLPDLEPLQLTDAIVPIDHAITTLVTWRFSCSSFCASSVTFFCWNMGVPGYDADGYPRDGYPWGSIYERVRTPLLPGGPGIHPVVDEPVGLELAVQSDETQNSNTAPKSSDTSFGDKPVHAGKRYPRRKKETTRERAERRKRNGGRKRKGRKEGDGKGSN